MPQSAIVGLHVMLCRYVLDFNKSHLPYACKQHYADLFRFERRYLSIYTTPPLLTLIHIVTGNASCSILLLVPLDCARCAVMRNWIISENVVGSA